MSLLGIIKFVFSMDKRRAYVQRRGMIGYMDYQHIVLLGNTTSGIQVKQSRSGTAYALFNVAVATAEDKTNFFPVMVFGDSAKIAGEILTKGNRVLVDGTVEVDRNSGKCRVLSNTFRKL